MHLDSALIPAILAYSSLFLSLISVLAALFFAPWQAVKAKASRQHSLYAAILLLVGFWVLGVRLSGAGITIHMLGITAVVVLFGWSLAVVAGCIAQCCLLLLDLSDAYSLGINLMLIVIVPASVSRLVLWCIEKLPFTNLYAYMLGGGFIGAILSVIVSATVLVGLSFWPGAELLHASLANITPYLFMLAFPEGFLNGTVVTAATVFAPDIVRTFNEDKYLSR
ncbi:energy-coupling factor ABC transporter permease [Kistimonas asteriae]|uniref:energy-coupling factor ABC transporter permease n=1 Tax=Kistimonas asteriae TaxID=517724 RepID=UPI001BA9876C|nr:energy-coupling factor ABC transporter permease [Kistimonas asteriae]